MAKETVILELKVLADKAKKKVDQVGKSVNNVKENFKGFGNNLKKGFKGIGDALSNAIPLFGQLRTALISTGVGALAVALGSLTALFIKAGKTGAEFAKSISGLKAVTGATSKELATLSNQAKQLGSTTAFTASQVVELQTELAKLGFSVSDIANSTPAILDLAASLDVSLASAAEFAGATVRSFGLDTQETQRVVDVLAASTAKSALDFGSLTEAMKLASPTARAVGVSVEKTTALLGVLADNGIKGSLAGTGLSKVFVELNKKGITLEKALDKVKNSSNKLNTAIELVGAVGAKSILNLAESGDKIKNLEQAF